MAEPAKQLAEQLRQDLAGIHWQVRQHEVGWVVRVGDGVAYVRGVPFGPLRRAACSAPTA